MNYVLQNSCFVYQNLGRGPGTCNREGGFELKRSFGSYKKLSAYEKSKSLGELPIIPNSHEVPQTFQTKAFEEVSREGSTFQPSIGETKTLEEVSRE